MSKSKFTLLKHSFFVSLFTTLSTFFAFFVQLILAKTFGNSYQMDAYFTTIAIPVVILRLAGSPLNAVFVPLFKEAEEQMSADQAKGFYSFLFWIFCAIFLVIAIIIRLFSDDLVPLFIAGADIKTMELTSNLLNIAAIYIFFVGMYYVTQTLHVAKQSFFVPFLGNMFSSCIMIAYTSLTISSQGIYAPMYGLLWGALAEFILNIIYLPSSIWIRPIFKSSLVVQFCQLFIPLGIGSLIYRSTPIIEKYYASFLSKGDISVLGYGSKFLESIVGFLAAGLSVVLLPLTSQHSARKDSIQLAQVFSWGVRATLLLVLPTIAYLMFFSYDVISALFERGNFLPEATEKVSGILISYTGALLALSLGGQITNIFYAMKKHNQVITINLLVLPLYIVLVSMLSKIFQVYGIAISYSLFTIITVIIYLFYLRKYITINVSEIFGSALKFMIASAVMVGGIMLTKIIINTPIAIINLALNACAGIVFYFGCLIILKSSEVLEILNTLSKKTTQKPS